MTQKREMDSHFRGNDRKESGNDIKGSGNDIKGNGNDRGGRSFLNFFKLPIAVGE